MTADQERELLAVAETAADAAAEELRTRYGTSVHGVHAKSTPTDLVSEADVSAEQAIRRVLAAARPGDAILGEEGGATDGSSAGGAGGVRWIVDPLDGTINYLYEIPAFAVSVACEDAAGALIVERAGLLVRELPETDEDPYGIVAAPAALIDELYALASGGRP